MSRDEQIEEARAEADRAYHEIDRCIDRDAGVDVLKWVTQASQAAELRCARLERQAQHDELIVMLGDVADGAGQVPRSPEAGNVLRRARTAVS